MSIIRRIMQRDKIFWQLTNLAVLLFLFSAQFALAQHATVHSAHVDYAGISYEHNHNQDKDNNGKSNISELCQIYISSKSFSHALTNNQTLVFVEFTKAGFIYPATGNIPTQYTVSAYLARAPPILLS